MLSLSLSLSSQVRKWVDEVVRDWSFRQVIPCHFAAPVRAGPAEFKQAFAFAYEGQQDDEVSDTTRQGTCLARGASAVRDISYVRQLGSGSAEDAQTDADAPHTSCRVPPRRVGRSPFHTNTAGKVPCEHVAGCAVAAVRAQEELEEQAAAPSGPAGLFAAATTFLKGLTGAGAKQKVRVGGPHSSAFQDRRGRRSERSCSAASRQARRQPSHLGLTAIA